MGYSRKKRRYGVTNPSIESGCQPKNEDERSAPETSVPAPDGGWGWMVVLGTFIINFAFGTAFRGLGVLYLAFLQKYQTTATQTAWVSALTGLIWGLFGPVASALCSKFSCRQVALLGGLLTSAGMVSTGFAPYLGVVYVTYGLVTGVGLSMSYGASFIILVDYFDTRKAKAMALGSIGSGIGELVSSPFIQYLQQYYGYTGCLLALGGIMLHICIAGALYFPLVKATSQSVVKSLSEQSGNASGTENPAFEGQPDVLGVEHELRKVINYSETADKDGLHRFTGDVTQSEKLHWVPDDKSPEKMHKITNGGEENDKVHNITDTQNKNNISYVIADDLGTSDQSQSITANLEKSDTLHTTGDIEENEKLHITTNLEESDQLHKIPDELKLCKPTDSQLIRDENVFSDQANTTTINKKVSNTALEKRTKGSQRTGSDTKTVCEGAKPTKRLMRQRTVSWRFDVPNDSLAVRTQKERKPDRPEPDVECNSDERKPRKNKEPKEVVLVLHANTVIPCSTFLNDVQKNEDAGKSSLFHHANNADQTTTISTVEATMGNDGTGQGTHADNQMDNVNMVFKSPQVQPVSLHSATDLCEATTMKRYIEVEPKKTNVTTTHQHKLFDLTLLKNPACLAFMFMMCIVMGGIFTTLTLIPALAVSRGVSPINAALIISANGIVDTIARLIFGIVFDLDNVKKHRVHIYNIASLLAGISMGLFPLVKMYPMYIVIMVMRGTGVGVIMSQRATVLGDLLGPPNVSNAFGLTVLSQAIGSLIGPIAGGVLKDKFGHYDIIFYLFGGLSVISFITFILQHIIFGRKFNETADAEGTQGIFVFT